MVKDECDVIEDFVRRNARFAQKLYVIDNGSEDGTLAILANLMQEGLPLAVYQYNATHFQQKLAINSLLGQVMAEADYSWVVPLDADEFITHSAGDLLALLDQAPPGQVCYLPWRNYFPIAEGAGLARRFVHVANEGAEVYKVIVPGNLILKGEISEGNHIFTIDGNAVPGVRLPAVIQHLPVRSAEQIVAKALIGSYRLALKPNRHPDEGKHWDDIAEYIRKHDYRLGLQDLQSIAYMYPAIVSTEQLPANLETAMSFDTEDLPLKYGQLAHGGVIQRLDSYLKIVTQNFLPS